MFSIPLPNQISVFKDVSQYEFLCLIQYTQIRIILVLSKLIHH